MKAWEIDDMQRYSAVKKNEICRKMGRVGKRNINRGDLS